MALRRFWDAAGRIVADLQYMYCLYRYVFTYVCIYIIFMYINYVNAKYIYIYICVYIYICMAIYNWIYWDSWNGDLWGLNDVVKGTAIIEVWVLVGVACRAPTTIGRNICFVYWNSTLNTNLVGSILVGFIEEDPTIVSIVNCLLSCVLLYSKLGLVWGYNWTMVGWYWLIQINHNARNTILLLLTIIYMF